MSESQPIPPPIPRSHAIPATDLTPASKITPAGWQLIAVTALCTVVAAATSGLPAWLSLISIALVGTGIAFRKSFAIYSATFILGGATLIPAFRWTNFQDMLWPIDLLHALAVLGLIACGVSYLEILSPAYKVWAGSDKPHISVGPSETNWSNWNNQTGRQSAFGQWWLMSLIAFCLAVFVLWWYPVEWIGPRQYGMFSTVVRLCRMFLFLFFPVWMMSSLLSIIAWRRISPIQAHVFNLRELHDEQGKEQVVIEKRVAK